MHTLTPRQKTIFNRIVDTHIETAEPVASKHIASLYHELYLNSYSTATVRHEMGVLESKGYLMQPHISAGRIPTDRGYRFYVDHSICLEEASQCGQADFEELFSEKIQGEESSPDEYMGIRASERLSQMSGEMSLVLLPRGQKSGHSFAGRVYLRGSSCLLEKPEFQSVEKVRVVYKKLDERDDLLEWFEQNTTEQSLSIFIGEESNEQAFRECSIIASRIRSSAGEEVIMAVIGPKRMRYSRTVPLVLQMASWMRRLLA